MKRKVCIHCGSTEVLRDTGLYWSEERQRWLMFEDDHNDWCAACEDGTRIVDEPMEELIEER